MLKPFIFVAKEFGKHELRDNIKDEEKKEEINNEEMKNEDRITKIRIVHYH